MLIFFFLFQILAVLFTIPSKLQKINQIKFEIVYIATIIFVLQKDVDVLYTN